MRPYILNLQKIEKNNSIPCQNKELIKENLLKKMKSIISKKN